MQGTVKRKKSYYILMCRCKCLWRMCPIFACLLIINIWHLHISLFTFGCRYLLSITPDIEIGFCWPRVCVDDGVVLCFVERLWKVERFVFPEHILTCMMAVKLSRKMLVQLLWYQLYFLVKCCLFCYKWFLQQFFLILKFILNLFSLFIITFITFYQFSLSGSVLKIYM